MPEFSGVNWKVYCAEPFTAPVLPFTSGLLSVILSIIIVSNPDYVNILLPMMVGLWFIINSTFKLRMALALKDSNNTYWPITYILSLLTNC